MKYAIIELAGRQFMVKEGDILKVTRQENVACNTLFYKDDSIVKIGQPLVENVTVVLEKIEDKNDVKVTVARYKSKSRYRRKKGHRQPISMILVKSIASKDAAEDSVKKVSKPSKTIVKKKEESK